MLKLVGAVLIIFASAGLGYLKSRELMLHEKNLEEFLQVILCLKGEIRCGNSSLSDALRDTACRCRGRYEEFLERVAACIEANTEEKLSIIFQNCTENYLTDLKLDEDERRKISLLGEKLGYLDREMQIRQLELYETDFLDFVKEPQEYSLKRSLSGFNNLFILKAFTKRYAMAGVRLGYGLCSNRKLLEKMELCVQPWNVSTMAQAAGIQALEETEYVEKGRQLVFQEAQWLKEEMTRIGYQVFPSEANYVFFKGPEELFDFCLRKRILIRDCSNYSGLRKGYYRVAVRTHEENQELIRAMRDGTTKAAVAHAEVLKEEEQA